MKGIPVLQPETINVAFDSGTVQIPNPYDPYRVVVSWLQPGSGVWTTSTWTAAVPGNVITRGGVGSGKFSAILQTPVDGFWRFRWQGFDVSSNQVGASDGYFVVEPSSQVPPTVPVLLSNGYPYPFGYCDVDQIGRNLSAGAWDPTSASAAPNVAQVEGFIFDSATQIDGALARTGYVVPLAPDPTFGPIKMQAFNLLKQINAALATALVERSRFGSQGDEASDAAFWMTYGDELLIRLQKGDDNYRQFGLASAGWVPNPNPALALGWGGVTDANGQPALPLFTRVDDGSRNW